MNAVEFDRVSKSYPVYDSAGGRLRELAETLPNFRFIPALSEAAPDDWDGETGLITDVVKQLAGHLSGAHAYVCGPPPMVEAAQVMLAAAGVEEKRIYFDKFTTTAD